MSTPWKSRMKGRAEKENYNASDATGEKTRQDLQDTSQPRATETAESDNNLAEIARSVLAHLDPNIVPIRRDSQAPQVTSLEAQTASTENRVQKGKRSYADMLNEETNVTGDDDDREEPPRKKQITRASDPLNNHNNKDNAQGGQGTRPSPETKKANNTSRNKDTRKTQNRTAPPTRRLEISTASSMASPLARLRPRASQGYHPPIGMDLLRQVTSYGGSSTPATIKPTLNEVLSQPPINFANDQHEMPEKVLVNPADIDFSWVYAPPANVVRRSQKQLDPDEIRRRLVEEHKGTDRKIMGEVKPLKSGRGWAFKDAKNPNWTKAEFHSMLRDRFIQEDAADHPAYDVEPSKGRHHEDITSRCTNQVHWTSNHDTVQDPQGRKLLTNNFQRNEYTVKNPPDWVLENGAVVIDVNAHAVRWFDGIPKTISSEIEPWRMEGMRAFNSMMVSDIMARMPRYTLRKDGDFEQLQQASAFTNRSIVWRDEFGLRSLKKGKPRKPIVISDDEAEEDAEAMCLRSRKYKKRQLKLDVCVKQEESFADASTLSQTPSYRQVPNPLRRKRDQEDDEMEEPAAKKQRTATGTPTKSRPIKNLRTSNRINRQRGFEDHPGVGFIDFTIDGAAQPVQTPQPFFRGEPTPFPSAATSYPHVNTYYPPPSTSYQPLTNSYHPTNNQTPPQSLRYGQMNGGAISNTPYYPGSYQHRDPSTVNNPNYSLPLNNNLVGINQGLQNNSFTTYQNINNATYSAYGQTPVATNPNSFPPYYPGRAPDPSFAYHQAPEMLGAHDASFELADDYQPQEQLQVPTNTTQPAQLQDQLGTALPQIQGPVTATDIGTLANPMEPSQLQGQLSIPPLQTEETITAVDIGNGEELDQITNGDMDFRDWIPMEDHDQALITAALQPTIDDYRQWHPDVEIPDLAAMSYNGAVATILELGTQVRLADGRVQSHPVLVRTVVKTALQDLEASLLQYRYVGSDGALDES